MENKDAIYTTNGSNALEEKGIEVEQCGGNKDALFYPVITRTINNNIDMNECMEIFNGLKAVGILKADCFEAMEWEFFSIIKDAYTKCNFDTGFDDETTTGIKKYMLVKVGIQEMSTGAISKIFNSIVRMLKSTDMLDLDKLQKFKQYLVSKQNRNELFICINFLKFSNMENSKEYLEALKMCHIPRHEAIRDIPNIYSMIRYDMVIMDLIRSDNMDLKYKYYPILMWWCITSIIPTRPNEFLMLKRDCLKVENGKYYITIDRIKDNKRNKPYVFTLKKFCISYELYKFIKDFVDYANEIDNGKFLVTQEYYNKCLKKPQKNIKHQRMTIHKMNYLYGLFEEEVVAGMNNYNVVEIGNMKDKNDIERLRLNDTRHYAFINMIMQDIAPEEVQLLGGHRNVNQQFDYFGHIGVFLQDKIYKLNMMSKDKGDFLGVDEYSSIDWSLKEIDKDKMGVAYYSLPKVLGGLGRCSSQDFPHSCGCNECLFCDHFYPDKNISKEYLEQIKENHIENTNIKKEVLSKLINANSKDKPNVETASQVGGLKSSLASSIRQELLLEIYIYGGKGKNNKNGKGDNDYGK